MLILDVECYSNYFLLSMLQLDTGKVRSFELHDDAQLDISTVRKLMVQHTTVSFNGNNYDLPLITAALAGWNNTKLKALSDSIITSKLPAYRICNDAGIVVPTSWDHIDLFEVAIGQASLKIYGGRMNCKTMQDLPINPSALINPEQRQELRDYCRNDLELTKMLYSTLKPQIDLRAAMSKQYGMDLRSKSDAQIAVLAITSELKKVTGQTYRKLTIPDGQVFRYLDPGIVDFKRKDLKDLLKKLLAQEFTLGGNGAVTMPDWLKDTNITIGASEYQLGIGGLHSCETRQYVRVNDNTRMADVDVASYYPSIILQQRLAPKSMGAPFLRVYQSIVERRIKAKREGDKVTADTLKIIINSSFGMLGSKYSPLYAPDLLIQTTITGQLYLLMLIECMDAAGVEVLSANTDGVVLYFDKALEQKVEEIKWDWMLDTSFELESTPYVAIASANVNNYVAVKPDGSVKLKGSFAPPGLAKNPDCAIIYTAVAQYLAKGTPLEQTIRGCDDITQFVTVRRVMGGAVWQGEPLGKAVRFYHSSTVPSDQCIHYATNSNRVPTSAGCRPLMTLPDTFPADVDYRYYLTEGEKMLCEVGV